MNHKYDSTYIYIYNIHIIYTYIHIIYIYILFYIYITYVLIAAYPFDNSKLGVNITIAFSVTCKNMALFVSVDLNQWNWRQLRLKLFADIEYARHCQFFETRASHSEIMFNQFTVYQFK